MGVSWGDDGSILLADFRGIHQVSDDGGEPRLIVPGDPGRFINGPLMLPGSRAFLYAVGGLRL